MGDGVEEVGFAQARVAVDEQGVVVLARRVGHRLGGGAGQAVGGAHHEGLEGEFPALHQAAGPVGLPAAVPPQSLLIQKLYRDVRGKDVLQPRLDVPQEPVLDVAALEGVGAV